MLHDRANAYSLGMVRVWVFGLAAVSRLFTPVHDVCLVPDYQAGGIMRLLGATYWAPLITPELAYGIQALTMGLLLLVAAGVGPYRLLAPLACLALTIAEGLVRGTGVPTHANIILILSTYILALFPAADAWTLNGKRGREQVNPAIYQAAMVSLSLMFCATYVFVAARRFSASGIAIYLDDSILCTTVQRDAELGASGGLGKWCCESVIGGWALRIGFPVVTLFELLTPLCLFSKGFRWMWMAVMIPFHVGAGLIMGIWFSYHFALIPILIAGFDPFRGLTRQVKAVPGEDEIRLAA